VVEISESRADKDQPASYSIWEEIQQWFNQRIKKMGVKNCSFPLFVSEDVLQREKDHIEGFAAEVAWVTHAYAIPLSTLP
jgi:prolyl-tRNA synthetase